MVFADCRVMRFRATAPRPDTFSISFASGFQSRK
jgi:hypothetical protein